jgi:hypothetical protein
MDTPDEQAERLDARRLATEAALVIDPRLADLWGLVWMRPGGEGEAVPLATLAALLRLAYAQGYADALGEDPPGGLYRDLGVRDDVVSRPRAARRSRRGRAASGNSGM